MSVIAFGVLGGTTSANWAHVYVVSKNRKRLEFEVLEVEADPIRQAVGAHNYVACGTDRPFWGRLVSLEPCESTVPELCLAQGLPTLKGIVEIEPPALDDQNEARTQ